MKNTIALLTALIALSQPALAEVLELRGLVYDAEGITIQVDSGGCTSKDTIRAVQMESFPVQLRFDRVEDDFCEAYLPYGVQLKYTYAELGMRKGSKMVVVNPMVKGTVIEVFR